MTFESDSMINKSLPLGTLFCLLYFFPMNEIQAIPVFARKYDQSCNMCHVAIPKLNAFGEAFRFNGYRLPKETGEQVKVDDVKLGGKVQRKLWPRDAVWPGAVPGSPPIAIRTLIDLKIDPNSQVKSDFDFPHEIELLYAANLGSAISSFLEIEIYENGEFGGLERGYIQFISPIRNSRLFNLKIGQFAPSITQMDYRRLTARHYITADYRNGANNFRLRDWQQGVEVWGIKDGHSSGGLFYAGGIVNGNSAEFSQSTKSSDNNSSKDFYARVTYKFGGLSYSGEIGPPPQGGNWRDNSLQLGGFAYNGKSLVSDFNRYGLDARWRYQDLDLFTGFVYGNDIFKDPMQSDMAFAAYFFEGNYVFLPWLLFVLRYEYISTPEITIPLTCRIFLPA